MMATFCFGETAPGLRYCTCSLPDTKSSEPRLMSFTCAFSALVSAKTEKCCLLNCKLRKLRGKDPPGLKVSITVCL